jgi:hypothetical protein
MSVSTMFGEETHRTVFRRAYEEGLITDDAGIGLRSCGLYCGYWL